MQGFEPGLTEPAFQAEIEPAFEPERLVPSAQGEALGSRSCKVSSLKGSFIAASPIASRHERPLQGRRIISANLPRPSAWADLISLSHRKSVALHNAGV